MTNELWESAVSFFGIKRTRLVLFPIMLPLFFDISITLKGAVFSPSVITYCEIKTLCDPEQSIIQFESELAPRDVSSTPGFYCGQEV